MTADTIHARRAVEVLRSGVPNRDAVREFGSTQEEIERGFRERLELARAGRSPGGVLVGGDFGSGKSHLLEYLQHVAVEEGFVASKVVISKETPLHDPVKVFRAAAENAVVPGRHGSALTEIASSLDFSSEGYARFYRFADSAEAGLNERFPASLYLFENLRSADREFADRIVRFWSGDPIGVGELKKKLRETGEAATWALSKIGARDLALQRFRFASQLIRAAGYAGWALLFDEVELIGRYSLLQRGKSYGELARWTAAFELEPIEGAPGDGHVEGRARGRILESDEDRGPGLVSAKLGHFALDPNGRQPAEIRGDTAIERRDREDLAVAVQDRLDLRHSPSVTPRSPCWLEQDLGGRRRIAAAREHLHGVVQIDLADREPLGEMHRIAGLEQDVQAPALDLCRLVLVPERSLGRLGHARGIRRCYGASCSYGRASAPVAQISAGEREDS